MFFYYLHHIDTSEECVLISWSAMYPNRFSIQFLSADQFEPLSCPFLLVHNNILLFLFLLSMSTFFPLFPFPVDVIIYPIHRCEGCGLWPLCSNLTTHIDIL